MEFGGISVGFWVGQGSLAILDSGIEDSGLKEAGQPSDVVSVSMFLRSFLVFREIGGGGGVVLGSPVSSPH